MNILLLCNRVPYPLKDGGAIAMYNMMKGLKETGNSVDVFALNTKKHHVLPADLPEIFTQRGGITTVDIDTSINPLDAFLNLFTHKSYNIERFHQKHVEQKLKEVLEANTYDLVQIEGLFMLPYIHVLRKYSKAKIAFRAHNVESQIWQRLASSAKGIKKWYLELLSKRILAFETTVPGLVDFIIPITPEDAGFFENHFHRVHIKVSPAGVDLEHFIRTENKPIEKSFFHLGALNWIPNQEAVKWLLSDIFQKLISIRNDFTIYIAGKHTPDSFLQYNNSNVVVLGEIDDAVQFMNTKQVMLVPLLSGSGMRLKIIEGMALGKAIISTSIGAEGIEYTDKENILIANTTDEFVLAIQHLLDHPEKTKALGEAASKLIQEKYNNKVIVEELLNYYKEELV